MRSRRLARPTVTAAATLIFVSSSSLGGLCFMDRAAAAPQHDCCKNTGLAPAPPPCCAGALVTVVGISPDPPAGTPPACAGDALQAFREASSLVRSFVKVAPAALSPPALLRV